MAAPHVHVIASHVAAAAASSHVVVPVPHASVKPGVPVIIARPRPAARAAPGSVTECGAQLVGGLEPAPAPATSALLVLVLSVHVAAEASPTSAPAHTLIR